MIRSIISGAIRLPGNGSGVSAVLGNPAATITGIAQTIETAALFSWVLGNGVTSAKARLVRGVTPESSTVISGASGTVSLTPASSGTYKAQITDSTETIVLWETPTFTVFNGVAPTSKFLLESSGSILLENGNYILLEI